MIDGVGRENSAEESGFSHNHLQALEVVCWGTCERSGFGECGDSGAGVGREHYGEVIVGSIDVYSAKILANLPSLLFYVPRFVYGVVEDGSTAEVWRLRVLADELHVPHQRDVMLLIPEVLSSGESLVGCV